MTTVKLTICIPTYNRAPYLRTALQNLVDANLGYSYEIVISDNASTDDTGAVVDEYIARGLPIRYLRCPVNAGPLPNFVNAIQNARGEYTVYQGDDDLLLPEGLHNALDYLDANPDVLACQAPWYLYDEVEDRDISQFYQLEQDVKFEAQDFVGMFQFLFEGHVFPEIGIYRTSVMKSVWIPRNFCFWAFSYLTHFLDQGAVAFLKQPFYRSVTVSKIAPQREQLGIQDVMTSWDMYRGGLEYFLHVGARRGKIKLTDDTRRIYDRMCSIFVAIRMSVAIRLWISRNDWLRAYDLYCRMSYAGYGDYPGVGELRQHFPVMVGLQSWAATLNSMPVVRHVRLSEMADPAYIESLLRDFGLEERISFLPDTDDHDPSLIGETAVLLISPEKEAAFLAKGYDPNMLFRENSLTSNVVI